MMQFESILVYKIVVAGDGGVGKTSFLNRYLVDHFDPGTEMTIAIDHYVQKFKLNEQKYELQIWDMGGQDRFRFLLQNFIKGTAGGLILFDLSRYSITMDSLYDWVTLLREKNEGIPIILVGTKYDIIESEEKFNESLIDEFANDFKEELNLQDYIKISAKTGMNKKVPIEKLLENILPKQE